MAYDSDAGFDSLDFGMTVPSADAATPSDGAASSAMAVAGAAAMAASLAQDDNRTAGGWDAPPPSASSSHAMSAGTGWAFDDDDVDDDGRNGGTGRRAPDDDAGVTAQGKVLREVALRAYTLHPDHGHQSTAEVAHHFGRRELDGQSANAQVATMSATWRTVDGARATALANRGVFVVAGLAGAGNAGHTAVVIPGKGSMADRRPYPRVCGGGLPMRRSDGGKTAADTWTAGEWKRVRYFTPETRSWFRRMLGWF